MTNYNVQNQWGGDHAPWHPGGVNILGSRLKQNPIAIHITSKDGGKTFTGTMTYEGEGPIGVQLTATEGDCYSVKNQWGGDKAPWHEAAPWLIGCRGNQKVVELNCSSADAGKTLTGKMTYTGEGPIGFKAELIQYQ